MEGVQLVILLAISLLIGAFIGAAAINLDNDYKLKPMLIKEHCGGYNKTTGEFIIKNEMICNVD